MDTQQFKARYFEKIRVLESDLYINPATRPSFDQLPMMTATSLHTGASANTNAKPHNSSAKKPCVLSKSTAHPPNKCDVVVEHQKRIDFIKGEISVSIALVTTRCLTLTPNIDAKTVRGNIIPVCVILPLPLGTNCK